jgi:glutaredoxin
MTTRIIFYTQPGCLSCELTRVYLEAHELTFEEHDISADIEARRVMTGQYDSAETPTIVILRGDSEEVVVGFDPVRLDELLLSTPSSDSVTEA